MEDGELGTTVGNFASRIRRKLKEQEAQQHQSNLAASERQAMVLKAMTAVRKALQDAAKISLGERFRFTLEISDWEGWPKLELRLIDSLSPDLQIKSLIATANDRNELGLIQLHLITGEILGSVQLKDANEFARLPLIMKKALRTFLDMVAHSVLHPTARQDSLEAQTAPLEDVDQQSGAELCGENVFIDEDFRKGENQVEIDAQPLGSLFDFAIPLKA